MAVRNLNQTDNLPIYNNVVTKLRGDTIFIPINYQLTNGSTYRSYLRQTPDSEVYFVLLIEDGNIVVGNKQSEYLSKGNWIAELEEKDSNGNVKTIQRTTIKIIEDYTRDTIYPIRRDYIVSFGDTWQELSSGIVLKRNSELANLTGSTIEFKILSEKGDSVALVTKTWENGGIIVSDTLVGEFAVLPFNMELSARELPYYWFIKVVLFDSFTKTIAEGYIKVK